MIVLIIFYFIIAIITTTNHNYRLQKEQRILWLSSFVLFFIYTLISHSYVGNPFTSYFISSDQTGFYSMASTLSSLGYWQIVERCVTEFEYSEASGAYALFAILFKIGKALGETDILLLLKSHVVFLSSLIPVMIYKIVIAFNSGIRNLHKQILLFAIFSPVFMLSAQLMRDIHICLLFTILAYVAIRPKFPSRILVMLIIIAITYTFRIENGMFATIFFAIPAYSQYKKGGILGKMMIVIIAIAIIAAIASAVFETMNKTLTGYTERSLEEASAGSLGAKLENLPFPINAIGKTIFAQFLPFPIWLPFEQSANEAYSYLRFVECFTPFYWLPVIASTFAWWWKYRKKWDSKILLLFYIGILYLLACSASEFNTRRLLAAYPLIFIAYIVVKNSLRLDTNRIRAVSYAMLIFIHFIYLAIK